MLELMLEVLTGTGLATSAGLNAYIPLLALGLLSRYTGLVDLPPDWQWLENGWVLTILAVLLAIEVVADKVPVLDHVNDAIQTVIRPTSGGLAFGAAANSSTVTVSDPAQFFESNQWVPIAAGVLISLIVHAMKAASRAVINAATVGIGAPIASTAEDVVSVVVAFIAIIFPILIVLCVAALVYLFVVLVRRRRRKRAQKLARQQAVLTHDGKTLDLWRQGR